MNSIKKNNKEVFDETTDESTDDSIDSTTIEKPKRTWQKNKEKRFPEERKQVLKKILNIIGINETKKSFTTYELEKNHIAQSEILNLIPDIEKYFSTSLWSFYQTKNQKYAPKKETTKYISIVKSILKDTECKVDSMQIRFIDSVTKNRINATLYTLN